MPFSHRNIFAADGAGRYETAEDGKMLFTTIFAFVVDVIFTSQITATVNA